MSQPLVEVRALVKTYRAGGGIWHHSPPVRAVDGVSLAVSRAEIVGLVGESGSGKTTLGRAVLRLVEPDSGDVFFDGIDIRGLSAGELRHMRRRMQIVFQDPAAALNPRMRVKDLVGEPLLIHRLARGKELTDQVVALLEEVGLSANALNSFPGEFSGGQRQRIGIARALGLRPDFVVLDEPVSALDVSVQAQIVNLLVELKERHGLAYLFIAHDLTLIRHLCDRIYVLYLGRVVESGPAVELSASPLHPYSRALFAAVPPPDPQRARRVRAPIPGEIPSPVDLPPGCRFHPRCQWAEARCRTEEPLLRPLGPGRETACHRAEEIPAGPV